MLGEPGPPPNHRRLRATHPLGDLHPRPASAAKHDPGLLDPPRQALAALGAGPHRANQALAAYLRAERELGRIPASVDPDTGAAMLLGACFQRAFLSAFSGQPIPAAERARFAASLATILLPDRA
jgi:AefR-like transcriptional repressor, C-terminal domain